MAPPSHHSGGGGGGKNPLRDKLEEDILDLSLMQLQEVPVNDIVSKLLFDRSLVYVFHYFFFFFFLGSFDERHDPGSLQQLDHLFAGTLRN